MGYFKHIRIIIIIIIIIISLNMGLNALNVVKKSVLKTVNAIEAIDR